MKLVRILFLMVLFSILLYLFMRISSSFSLRLLYYKQEGMDIIKGIGCTLWEEKRGFGESFLPIEQK